MELLDKYSSDVISFINSFSKFWRRKMKTISKFIFVNPIYPLINLTRYSYLGVYEGNLLIHLFLLIIITVITFTIAFYTFKKGIGLKN